jgi:hypothetical protein
MERRTVSVRSLTRKVSCTSSDSLPTVKHNSYSMSGVCSIWVIKSLISIPVICNAYHTSVRGSNYYWLRHEITLLTLHRFFLRRLWNRESLSSYDVSESGLIMKLLVSNNNWFIIGPTVRSLLFFFYLPWLTLVLDGPGDRSCRLVEDASILHCRFTDHELTTNSLCYRYAVLS